MNYGFKKVTKVLLILVTLLFVLSGCKKPNNRASQSSTTEPTQQTTEPTGTDTEPVVQIVNDSSLNISEFVNETYGVKLEVSNNYYYFTVTRNDNEILKILDTNGNLVTQIDELSHYNNVVVTDSYTIILGFRNNQCVLAKFTHDGTFINEIEIPYNMFTYMFDSGSLIYAIDETDSKKITFINEDLNEEWSMSNLDEIRLLSSENPKKPLFSFERKDPITNMVWTTFLRVNSHGEKTESEQLSGDEFIVKMTNDDGFVVDQYLYPNVHIIKYGPNNNREWSKELFLNSYVLGTGQNRIIATANDSSRQIFIYDLAGNEIKKVNGNGLQVITKDAIYITSLSTTNSFLIKYDLDGNLIWSKELDLGAGFPKIEASYTIYSPTDNKKYLVKLDENGNEIGRVLNQELIQFIKKSSDGTIFYTYGKTSKHLIAIDSNQEVKFNLILGYPNNFYFINDQNEIYYTNQSKLIKTDLTGVTLASYPVISMVTTNNEVQFVIEDGTKHYKDMKFDQTTETITYSDTIQSNSDFDNLTFDLDTNWQTIVDHTNDLTNYSLYESNKLSYKLDNTPFNFKLSGHTDYRLDPLYIYSNYYFDIGSTYTNDKMYINMEDRKYYFYQYVDDLLVKREISQAEYLDYISDDLVSFSLSFKPIHVTDTQLIVRNASRYSLIRHTFKYNEMNDFGKQAIDSELSFYFGNVSSSLYENAEIKAIILFNIDEMRFEQISYDTKELFDLCLKNNPTTGTKTVSNLNATDYIYFKNSPITVDALDQAILDDYANDPQENMVQSLPIIVDGNIDYSDDLDYFTFTLDEAKKVMFSIDSNIDIVIYDEFGNEYNLIQVGTSGVLELNPGKYYVEVSGVRKAYHLSITEVPADNASDTLYTDTLQTPLINESVDYTGSFDYNHDIDLFQVVNSTNGFLNITMDSTDSISFKYIIINKETGYINDFKTKEWNLRGDISINIQVILTNSEAAYFAISGTTGPYTIEFNYYNDSTDTPDSVNDANIDVLTGDHHQFVLENPSDWDVIEFSITEAGEYNLFTEANSNMLGYSMKVYDESKTFIKSGSNLMNEHLEPGTYYVELQTTNIEYGVYNFYLRMNKDDYITPQEIDLATTNIITGATETKEDVDVFHLIVSQDGLYKIDMIKGNLDKKITIKNIDDTTLYSVTFIYSNTSTFDYYFISGDYTIEISNNYFQTYDYAVKITQYLDFTEDYPYGTKTLIDFNQMVTGKFEYKLDMDTFLLEVIEPGNYILNFTNTMDLQVFNPQGESVAVINKYYDYSINMYKANVNFAVGTYQFNVTKYQYGTTSDYSFIVKI